MKKNIMVGILMSIIIGVPFCFRSSRINQIAKDGVCIVGRFIGYGSASDGGSSIDYEFTYNNKKYTSSWGDPNEFNNLKPGDRLVIKFSKSNPDYSTPFRCEEPDLYIRAKPCDCN